MSTGSTQELRAYCDGLVELFEDTPGYMMTFGCSFEWTTDAKIVAYRDLVRKWLGKFAIILFVLVRRDQWDALEP